ERSHLRSGLGTKAVDQLTELAASFGVPHWPGAVALAVCECVVRPGLVGFAGGILGPWHVAGDLDLRRRVRLRLAVGSASDHRQDFCRSLCSSLLCSLCNSCAVWAGLALPFGVDLLCLLGRTSCALW